MVQCPSCQFIYLNPRPTLESLHQFYQEYLPDEEASIESWRRMMKPVFKRAKGLIQRLRSEGRLLDVGCGFGFFLAEMKNCGWEVLGIEIAHQAIRYAREVLKLNILSQPLERAGFPDQYFHVITGFYVIEHLPDPMNFLKECFRILKPGGFILLRYPHTTPIKNLLQVLGIQNRLYDLPAHLNDFSPRMIQRCLKRVGFIKFKHLIGGFTLPGDLWKRTASILFGNFSEILFYLSFNKILFPGVSKTIIAYKGEL